MDNFLEKHSFLHLKEEEIENMSFLTIREIESVISSFLEKEFQSQMVSLRLIPNV